MPTDTAPPARDQNPRLRPGNRFSAKLVRQVCIRLAAGETQVAICADPAMPSRATIGRWARERPGFARIFARAKAAACRLGGANSTDCPVTAHEVVTRVAEGETLTSIAADPAMPSMGSLFYWRKANPEFDDGLRVAREALAERFSDLGWRMAQEATPRTAHLTRVRLSQLRWTAAILSPRSHGRIKPAEPPPEAKVVSICYRHFQIEVHPETGDHRVVGYRPDPRTMRPERDSEGPWTPPVDRVRKAADCDALAARRETAPGQVDPDDPEGWR
ncbi:hypothetical protein [Phenylobacterium sp.]|uniref:terminase small subunit-like protein n=1 Tax=Phenylobacterium sp. TaxID=1871053 RepID=UPI00374CE972